MTGDVLARCRCCGEYQRRLDLRDDDRGQWWLVACSIDCPATWRLIVADVQPNEDADRDTLSPLGLRRAILRTQRAVHENGERIDALERRLNLP